MLDTHCHIDLYPKPELILNECDRHGFPILSMTNLPSHFEKGLSFFENRKKVRQALGMHPLYARHHKKELPKFVINISKTSYIGEVGLDFSKEGISTKDIQIQTFTEILKIASGKEKILSIHSRKAEREVLNLLRRYGIRNAIFHWYSGNLNLVEEISHEGYYFSINSAMIKSSSGKRIVSKIPKNLILTETDGPFVQEDGKPVKPGEVQPVVKFLKTLWNLSEAEITNTLLTNFSTLIQRLK